MPSCEYEQYIKKWDRLAFQRHPFRWIKVRTLELLLNIF